MKYLIYVMIMSCLKMFGSVQVEDHCDNFCDGSMINQVRNRLGTKG